MKEWDGTEKRSGGQWNIYERLSGIENQLSLLTQAMTNSVESRERHEEAIKAELEKHGGTIYGNGQEGLTSKVNAIKEIKDEIAGHATADRWMFGIIITMLGATVLKLFIK